MFVAVSTQLPPSQVSTFPIPAPAVSTSERSEIADTPLPPRQLPLIEKHPSAMSMPLERDVVALPVILRDGALTPPKKVVVALVEPMLESPDRVPKLGSEVVADSRLSKRVSVQ